MLIHKDKKSVIPPKLPPSGNWVILLFIYAILLGHILTAYSQDSNCFRLSVRVWGVEYSFERATCPVSTNQQQQTQDIDK